MARSTPLRLSRLGTAVEESAALQQSRRVTELRARDRRVFDFTVGEPDCPSLPPVLEAAHRAIDTGHTRYTPTAGSPDLRAAVARHYAARHGIPWRPEETIVSAGAKQVLWNAMACLVEPGDEVVLLAPYWVSYAAFVRLLGAVPRIVRAPAGRDYKATGDDLRAVLGPRTRVLLFNTPVNPTGAVYSAGELRDLFAPLLDRDLVILSDEIYERMVHDGEHVSPLQVYPELADRMLVATGASKSYAMTGWRIGFGLGPEPLVQSMIRLQSHTTGNPNSVAQRAALAALELEPGALGPMQDLFRHRRDVCLEMLQRAPEVGFPPPRGAFFLFLNVEPFYGEWRGGRRIEGSERLAEHLLEEHGVAVVPGQSFDNDAGIRLSYTLPEEDLRQGLDLLLDALRQRW